MPSVSLALSNPTLPYVARSRGMAGGYPGDTADQFWEVKVPRGEPGSWNEGGPGHGTGCAAHDLDRGGAAFPPPGADTITSDNYGYLSELVVPGIAARHTGCRQRSVSASYRQWATIK